MWKLVATLASMVVTGIVTQAVTNLILMHLGLQRYDNYEHYGIKYPALVWGPAAIGFLAPGVVVWYLHKRGTRRGRSG
jgi:hypothetical protein